MIDRWAAVSGRAPLLGRLDPAADRYVRACVATMTQELGSVLVGVYLYSSGALGDFVPGRSDVDLVAVVADRLPQVQALALAAALRQVPCPHPTKGLDLTVVTLDAVRQHAPRPRVELKMLTFHGEPHTADEQPDGDGRVVMHFACCRDHGIAVVGPPAREVFAPVSRPDFLVALAQELNRVWMTPHYTVLNACRDLRFVVEGVICSKIEGGWWALDHGLDQWLIEAALAWQTLGFGPVIDGAAVDQFAGRVADQVSRAIAGAPAPGAGTPPQATSRRPRAQQADDVLAQLARPPEHFPVGSAERVLVTCVLVAGDDLHATLRSAAFHAMQDYPHTELVVVAAENSVAPLRAALDGHRSTHVVAAEAGADVGAQRDAGVRAGHGELIALWDENAWYAPWRLSYQVGALLRTSHDLSAASSVISWDPASGQAWPERSTPLVGQRQPVAATVCLTHAAWRRLPFAHRNYSDPANAGVLDAVGPALHVPDGAHFAVVVRPGSFAAAPRPTRFPPAVIETLLGDAMHAFASDVPVPQPPRPAADLDAVGVPHAADSTAVDAAAGRTSAPAPGPAFVPALPREGDEPLVSCVMPTFNRRRFIPQALRNLERQDYPNLELVVVDDGAEPVADLLADLPYCRYIRVEQRSTIGRKRNIACEEARGSIIVQWDDDDWYGPHRVRRQVGEIVAGNADVTGIGVNLLLDVRSMRVWSTREREAANAQFASIEAVAGGTLAFSKDAWTEVGGYQDASLGEDIGLLLSLADAGKRAMVISNLGAYVYIRHGRNSWRYDFDPEVGPRGWNPAEPPPAMVGEDLAFYGSLLARSVSPTPTCTIDSARTMPAQ